MNYYELHIGDFIRDTVSLTMLEEGAYRRLMDQAYQTERPLPADKKMVYRLARANTAPERKAVDFVLASFFQLTEDGFSQKRIQAEIERYQEKQRKAKASADARWNKHKSTSEHDANASQTHDAPDMRTHCEGNAHQTPDTRHQTPVLKPIAPSASTQAELVRALDDAEMPSSNGEKPEVTPAARISQAMRKHGVMSQPGDPRIIALADQGVTIETIDAACEEAKQAKPNERIGPAYVAAIVQRWASEAKAIDATGAKPPEQKANGKDAADRWWLTDQGIVRKGRELGMFARGNETYGDFKDRIFTKLREQGATA